MSFGSFRPAKRKMYLSLLTNPDFFLAGMCSIALSEDDSAVIFGEVCLSPSFPSQLFDGLNEFFLLPLKGRFVWRCISLYDGSRRRVRFVYVPLKFSG